MSQEEIKDMNLFQRLHAIMSEVGMVSKDGDNSFHKYKYASEAAYLKAIRPLLIKYRVQVVPSVGGPVVTPADNSELVHVVMRFTFVNIDNPDDQLTTSIPASGGDKGDKAIYKALTGAKKYLFSLTFMTETGDDAEANANDYEQQKPKTEKKSLLKGAKKTSFNPTAKKEALEGFGV